MVSWCSKHSDGNFSYLCTHKLCASPHADSQTLDSDLILMAVIWCYSSSKERMMVCDKKRQRIGESVGVSKVP